MRKKRAWKAVDTAELIKPASLRGVYRLVQPLVERWMGVTKIDDIHEAAMEIMERDKTSGADGFSHGCLEHLQAEVIFGKGLIENLRKIEGPVVVVANHPYGCIDAMGLIRCMQEARPEKGGWKIMANRILRSIEALREVTLAVDPFAKDSGRSGNVTVMKEAIRYLKAGGMLGLFPAGRVSAMSDDLGAVCDLPWSDHALKLAKASGAHVVVVHIDGQNSEEFLSVPTGNVSRRAMMLAREVPKMTGKKVRLSHGGTLSPSEVKRLAQKGNIAQLHARCYAAKERTESEEQNVAENKVRDLSATMEKTASNELLQEIESLRAEAALWQNESLSLLLFRGDQGPHLLEQVGRGRAVTFAAIGAGSGDEVDLSKEDQYYHHIVLWDHEQNALIGAYRIGFTQEVIKEHGVHGLYLDHVFEIEPQFYEQLGSAMELSRSFILPTYQKNPQMLDFLWRGLGMAAQKMGCETLFGSVTISASYSALSQAVLVETLDKFYSDGPEMRSLIKARVRMG